MEGNYETEPEFMKEQSTPFDPPLIPNSPTHRPAHYYGDRVRRILFAAGMVMAIGLPLFSDKINFGFFLPVLGILALNLFAGLTNPKQVMTILIDLVISFLGLAFFELIAYFDFATFQDWGDMYFWFNQTLAVLFFISLYFSVKTLRGMMVPE